MKSGSLLITIMHSSLCMSLLIYQGNKLTQTLCPQVKENIGAGGACNGCEAGERMRPAWMAVFS